MFRGIPLSWERFCTHFTLVIVFSALLVPILLQSSKYEVERFIGAHNITIPYSSVNIDCHKNEFTAEVIVHESPRKSRLILHVGPSKSATTSLQTDMTAFQSNLYRDGFLYAGRYYRPFVNETSGLYHVNRSESSLVTAAHTMLLNCDLEPRILCCQGFADELDDFSTSGEYDVILSEEPLGNQWRSKEDWIAIRDAIGERWDVTVVVGYRRFYSWLVSSHFQRERLDRSHGGLNDLWVSQGGRAKQPLFPKWYHNYDQTYRHTFHILDAIQDVFPVKVINLHNIEELSPPTLMFCRLFQGITQVTCQRSHRHDSHPTVINTHDKVPSLYYDAIATAAETSGLIDGMLWNRSTIRDNVWQFHELGKGLGPHDLPLDCPTNETINELLQHSLWIESHYMSDFFYSNATVQADHVAGFNSYVEQSIFCWVDTGAVLELPEWIEFFARYASNASNNYTY